MGETLETYFVPRDLVSRVPIRVREEVREAQGFAVTLRHGGLAPEGIRALAGELASRRERLRGLGAERVIGVLDAVAARWLDVGNPLRKRLSEAIAAATGFSPTMVLHALDLEQKSSRARHLVAALTQELGRYDAAFRFGANGFSRGRSMAVGPRVTGAWFSANIPGLPHLDVMRSLLVASPCLGKVASGEPIFLAAWCRMLEEYDAELASCVAAIAIERDDAEGRAAFLSSVEHLIAYGGVEAIATLRSEKPQHVGATWHGHRLGFAVLLNDAAEDDPTLRRLARELAYDFSLFDQQACLAPTTLYVEEGGVFDARAVARAVGEAMHEWLRELPARESGARAMAGRQLVDGVMMDGGEVVEVGPGFQFVVTVEVDGALRPAPLSRAVRVVAFEGVAGLKRHLAGMGEVLQCAAVEGRGRREEVVEALALSGVTRVTRAGLMGLPTMMWRHDGVACLSGLVRFCDEELAAPEQVA